MIQLPRPFEARRDHIPGPEPRQAAFEGRPGGLSVLSRDSEAGAHERLRSLHYGAASPAAAGAGVLAPSLAHSR